MKNNFQACDWSDDTYPELSLVEMGSSFDSNMSLVLLEKWTPWTLKYDMTLLYVHSLIRPLVLVIATWVATTQTHTGKTLIIWSKMAYFYIIHYILV